MSSSRDKGHGKSLYQTTKVISFLLSDTTITHRVQLKEKSEKIKSSLNEKEKRLESQTFITKKIRKQVRLKDRWDKIVKKELELYELRKEQEIAAAITIQRILKGCLVRSKYTDTILKIKEFKTSLEITTLRGQTDMCMLTLGINTVPATIRLQRAYRRHLFYKKIVIFQKAYLKYLEKLKNECENFIKSCIPIFFSKQRLSHLRFLKYRQRRMQELKENLAILTIKKAWRRKKLNIRTLKQKIQRIKRIRIAKQNKEAFEKYLASIGGNLPTLKKESDNEVHEEENPEKGPTSDENKERIEEEKIYKESERIQAMIQNRIRYLVDKGKLAHGIPKPRITSAAPVMENKPLPSHQSEIHSKLMQSTVSVNAKSRPASRENPARKRTFIINSPKIKTSRLEYWHHYESLTDFSQTMPEFDAKKLVKSAIGSERYLASTQSFAIKAKYNKEWRRQGESEPPKSRKKKIRVKLANVQKVQEKNKELKRWIPVARSFHKYVPGIDNVFYSPPVTGTRETSKQNNTNVSIFTNTQHLGNFSVLSFMDQHL